MITVFKMEMEICWIYLVLFMPRIHASTSFADTLCLSSATKMTGTFHTLLGCARGCGHSSECQSFFYDSTAFECYSVDKVLTSKDGCGSKAGADYFVQSAEYDCYNYTQEDQNQIEMSSERDQCESYPFNVYTAGDNQEHRECGNCSCCQQKGCTNGEPRSYNGTWSQTKNGRICQRWDSQTPHEHTRDYPSGFPFDSSVYDAHNYCRDPDLDGGPWCYTVDPDVRWESCGVPLCSLTINRFGKA